MKLVSGPNLQRALLPTVELVDPSGASAAMEPRIRSEAIEVSPTILLARVGIYVCTPYS